MCNCEDRPCCGHILEEQGDLMSANEFEIYDMQEYRARIAGDKRRARKARRRREELMDAFEDGRF